MDSSPLVRSNSWSGLSYLEPVSNNDQKAIDQPLYYLFTENEDHNRDTYNTLEAILKTGTEEQKVDACVAMLEPIQNEQLPFTLRDKVKNFILLFLEQIITKNRCTLDLDIDQKIADLLKSLLIVEIRCRLTVKSNRQNYVSSLNCSSQISSHLEIQDTSFSANQVLDCGQQIEHRTKRIRQIYTYLQVHSKHIDDQLLDLAFWNLNRDCLVNDDIPKAIRELLVNFSKSEDIRREAARDILNISSYVRSSGMLIFLPAASFEDLLNATKTKDNRPKTAYLLGLLIYSQLSYYSSITLSGNLSFRDGRVTVTIEDAIKYLELAVMQGNIEAVDILKKIVGELDDENAMSHIEQICIKSPLVQMKELKDAITYKNDVKRLKIRIQTQASDHGFSMIRTIEMGTEKGIELLFSAKNKGALINLGTHSATQVFTGFELLTLISGKIHHPQSANAKRTLDQWLTDMKALCWVINRCGVTSDGSYNLLVEKQIGLVLGQVKRLKDQGDFKAADRLVYQLIDALIAIDMQSLRNNEISHYYQLLIDSQVIDESIRAELKMRQAICEKKQKDVIRSPLINAEKKVPEARPVLINAAHMLHRPIASWLVGLLNNVDIFYRSKSTADLNEDTARSIQTAIHFLKKAIDEGLTRASHDLNVITNRQAVLFKLAESHLEDHKKKGIPGNHRTFLDQALALYKFLSLTGHEQANFIYLDHSAATSAVAQLELGKLYLTGDNAPFPEQDRSKAKELLESAALSGNTEAADLLDSIMDADDTERAEFALVDEYINNGEAEDALSTLRHIANRHLQEFPELLKLFNGTLPTAIDSWYEDRGPLFTRIALKLAKIRWQELPLNKLSILSEETERKKEDIRGLAGLVWLVGGSQKNKEMKLELGEWYLTRDKLRPTSSEEKERALQLLEDVNLKEVPPKYEKMKELFEKEFRPK